MKRKFDEARSIAREILVELPLIKRIKEKGFTLGAGTRREGNVVFVDYVCRYSKEKFTSLVRDIPGLCVVEIAIPDDSQDYTTKINPFNDPRFDELLELLK